MRISELSRSSGVPVATIKYYLREGILPAGESRGATQAEYGDDHLRRLRLIRSLAELAGLPIAQIKVVLDVIEHPRDDLFTTLGRAIEALPPYLPRSAGREHPLAEAAIEHTASGRSSENPVARQRSCRNATTSRQTLVAPARRPDRGDPPGTATVAAAAPRRSAHG